jgi:hypothetical protein
MNHIAGRRPYPQGCGQILWISRRQPQARADAAPEAWPTVTRSVLIHARLTAQSNGTLSPNKYTSWGKLCGLRWEMVADLGIDCGRYVVIPSCPRSFAGLYAGAGETVPHLELRIRELSPASTQPTTTYLFILVSQDRHAIGTGALGDNPTPEPRALALSRHPSVPSRDVPAVSRLGCGWQAQTISPIAPDRKLFTRGFGVTCARHLGRWSTEQTIGRRPYLFSQLSQPSLTIARRMVSQPSGISSAYSAGHHYGSRLASQGELALIRPQKRGPRGLGACADCRRVLSDRRGKQDWCGLRRRPREPAEMTKHGTPSRGRLEWRCDYSRRRFL